VNKNCYKKHRVVTEIQISISGLTNTQIFYCEPVDELLLKKFPGLHMRSKIAI